MLVGAFTGYGGRAYGACTLDAAPPGTSTYHCSGDNTVNTTTQSINHVNAEVITDPSFGVNAAAGSAVTITGDGALSYTDVYSSPLTAEQTGLSIRSNGDDGITTPGSVTVNTNGVVSGALGIGAYNNGSGMLTVTANGDVTSTTDFGILAINSGTDLTVTTGVGTTVFGPRGGILAVNDGSGKLTVTANGDVKSDDPNSTGILAWNRYGTDLIVTTGVGTTVIGGFEGIQAENHGSGMLSITAKGSVTGTNPYSSGILAENYSGTDITVTTDAGTTVAGEDRGIEAWNFGSGSLTVTANGDVTGTGRAGISAENKGTYLKVTTGVGTTVTGGNNGISAGNNGSGMLTVIANGNVSSEGSGISAENNSGTFLSVTTGEGTTVTGGENGIDAQNSGSGALTVTANGNVSGTGSYGTGISAQNGSDTPAGTDLTVTTGAGTTVSHPGRRTMPSTGTTSHPASPCKTASWNPSTGGCG